MGRPFRQNRAYCKPSSKPFIINYRVENREWLLAQLRKGITVVGDVKLETYGKFAWIMDPGGEQDRAVGAERRRVRKNGSAASADEVNRGAAGATSARENSGT